MGSDSTSSSPSARPSSSGRKGSKKVRTGCVTCKIRKVKCDETKPSCLRCTRTGRKCDGYLDPKAQSKRRRHDSTPSDQVLGTILGLSTPEEKRAFYYFQHITAPCISGEFDTAFWRVMVLQISQTEPAVRHAVLAVSSLHEGLGVGTIVPTTEGGISQSSQSFALQQYNKAITRLLEQINNSHTGLLTSLLTCILFVCIEYLQGKDKESLIHLEQGRQLLTTLDQQSNDPEVDCIVRHIVPLYTRLSLTFFLFGGSPVPIPGSLKLQNNIPDTFESIDSMRNCMHNFMEQAFRFTQYARPAKIGGDSISRDTMRELEIEQDRLLSQLAKLDVSFSLFRALSMKQGPESTILVLQMYLHAQHIWISTALSSSEAVYDNFLAAFAAIVPLAAAYLDLEGSQRYRGPSQPLTQRPVHPPGPLQYTPGPEQLSVAYTTNFSFDTHIIPPLYYVATKCRHPLIRRSALDLLKRNPYRRENLWRASVMGALAGHIVALEEGWSRGQSLETTEETVSAANASEKPQAGTQRSPPPGHMSPPHPQSHENRHYNLYNSSMCDEKNPDSVPTAMVRNNLPILSSECVDAAVCHGPPIDPSLLIEAEVSSSLPHVPSLSTSLEDDYRSSSATELAVASLGPVNHQKGWLWPQQLGSSAPVFHNDTNYGSEWRRCYSEQPSGLQDCSPRSRSSDESSVDAEENGYQMLTQAPSGHQHASHNQETSAQETSEVSEGRVPSNPITEAPFGLPEELRVHDVIMGPEMENGSWVLIFRKLHGADADWDVQHDWVTVV